MFDFLSIYEFNHLKLFGWKDRPLYGITKQFKLKTFEKLNETKHKTYWTYATYNCNMKNHEIYSTRRRGQICKNNIHSFIVNDIKRKN